MVVALGVEQPCGPFLPEEFNEARGRGTIKVKQ
jgi:hypothetical protein